MVELLRASDVGYEYPGGVRALEGASLALRAGELAAVLGPNGSGKSTLLKVLAGILQPHSGSAMLRGVDLAELAPRERAREIALVPQGLERVPAVRVRDFVLGGRYAHFDFFRTPKPADREAVERALAEADAGDWGDRLLGELSGGERQRAMIARALAQESAALLLDEPTASLDPEHQLRVLRLVRSLADGGRAVAVVTHDLNLASQYGDRIALMHRGRIVAEGTARDVLCAEVLEPVYGPGLHFGAFPDGAPLVLPRRN